MRRPLLLVAGLAGCASGPAPDALSRRARGLDHVRDCAIGAAGPDWARVIDAVEKGDVNGDGRIDTLVVDECKASTSRWPSVVEVFDGASDPARPSRLGTLMEGDPD